MIRRKRETLGGFKRSVAVDRQRIPIALVATTICIYAEAVYLQIASPSCRFGENERNISVIFPGNARKLAELKGLVNREKKKKSRFVLARKSGSRNLHGSEKDPPILATHSTEGREA